MRLSVACFCAHVTALGALSGPAPGVLRAARPALLQRARFAAMQLDGADEPPPPPPGAGGAAAGADGEPNLAAMSFDERLAFLSEQAADAVPIEKPEENIFGGDEDTTLFGISDVVETQWWRPAFWKLCVQDLQELTWPSRKQVSQTVITSQVAFVVILVLILVLDAVFESGMRSLLLDEPFSITIDAVLKKKG